MIAAQAWELYYTGMVRPQHLLRATKAGISANAISATDNARLAEWILKSVEFDNIDVSREKRFAIQNGALSSERIADYTKYIHAVKSEEIRSKFETPEIQDDEAE